MKSQSERVDSCFKWENFPLKKRHNNKNYKNSKLDRIFPK